MSQEPFLLHESIRDNLLWACPDATEPEMREALRLASADFVDTLEEGLDTLVKDRGGRLSGGERQRIVLAAALLRKPALLVLDEATNQLDADNENRIIETLRHMSAYTTIVIITHSDALLRLANHVLVMDSGRVDFCGSWQGFINDHGKTGGNAKHQARSATDKGNSPDRQSW